MRAEVASIPKPGRAVNEDLAVAFGNVFAVIDGASVPQTLTRCCDRSARWYVEHLAEGLLAQLVGDPQKALAEALAGAVRSVTTEHLTACKGGGVGPSAAVALVRLGADAVDYLVLGDCTIVAKVAGAVDAVSDSRLSSVGPGLRRSIRQRLADGGRYEHPDHRRDVDALVREQLAVRNTTSGYWIAADNPSAAEKAMVGSWRVSDTTELALISDGAARAVDVLQLIPSWDPALAALHEQGCGAFLCLVRDAEAGDPDGQRFPRTSRSDDATVIYVSESEA